MRILTKEYLESLTTNQLDDLHTQVFNRQSYHLSRDGYIHYLEGKSIKE